MEHSIKDLEQYQSLSLNSKISLSNERIKAWYEYWCKYEILNLETKEIRYETAPKMSETKAREHFDLKEHEDIGTIENGQVYIAFSGGKDSTVLLHLVRNLYPDVEAVFVNTGLEYPDIQEFVKTFDNVTILRPKMRFDQVISTYGYPMISKQVSSLLYNARNFKRRGELEQCKAYLKFKGEYKDKHGNKSMYNAEKWAPLLEVDFDCSHMCCNVMKKAPSHDFSKQTGKKSITGQMASESLQRTSQWLKNGCNGFDLEIPQSNPISFWTEQDVLKYIKENNIKIAKPYGAVVYTDGLNYYEDSLDDTLKLITTGLGRTGCMFCGFGAHLESDVKRYEFIRDNYPKQYSYCMGGGQYNEEGIWKPNKEGLGMSHVLKELNNIYGEGFIKY